MTSSAKQTDAGAAAGQAPRPVGPPISPALAAVLFGAVLLVLGWAVILHSYHWHLGAPALFLFLGWGAILLSARYLWQSAWSAANEPRDDLGESFWRPVGKREELIAEKKALLKAIKEVEFDYDMGKMSDQDAGELTRYYRLRAIEVIKALDSSGDDASLPTAERIKRDVEARLAMLRAPMKKSSPSKVAETSDEVPADASASADEPQPETPAEDDA